MQAGLQIPDVCCRVVSVNFNYVDSFPLHSPLLTFNDLPTLRASSWRCLNS